MKLLQHGPKFALNPSKMPYMDIISATESSALILERAGQRDVAEDLRQKVARLLSNAKPPKPNISHDERLGLKFLKDNKKVSITPFD
jgi:hypothetical protein